MTPRDRAISWARRMIADRDAVVLDLETTGLAADSEIVDVAVVAMDGRVILDDLVCPLRTIPPEAVKFHGVTERMVAKAPLFREFYPRLASAICEKTLCIYNGEYDVGVIRQVCAADHLRDPIGAWQCAMLAYSDFDGTVDPRHVGRDRSPIWGFGRDRFKWWRLSEAAERLGIAVPSAHRALADCLTTLAVVKAMAAAGAEPVQTGLPLGDAPGLRQPIGRDWTEEAKGGTR